MAHFHLVRFRDLQIVTLTTFIKAGPLKSTLVVLLLVTFDPTFESILRK